MSASSVAAAAPLASRAFDIVLWGATGFTGQLVAQYLAGATGRKTAAGFPPLKWALGGRDSKKLAAVKAGLTVDAKIASEPELVVADSDDPQSLQKMAASTRVVLSTVGPYTKFGEPLVAACVKTGTSYCDITGETLWTRNMIDKYGEAAAKNGAILSNSCGFDSVPSDLGTYLAAAELRNRYKTPAVRLSGYTSVKGGGVSGGTIASMLGALELPASERKKMSDVYLLNEADFKPRNKRVHEADLLYPRFDATIGRWTAPWLMAMVNTRVSRRSLSLRRALGDSLGDEAAYSEVMEVKSPLVAFGVWIGLMLTMLLLALPPTRWLLQKTVLPAPGQGPSEAARRATRFTHRVVGEGENGQMVEARISGGDPGYTDTAKMVGEVALLLAQERDQLELNKLVKSKPAGRVGGFFPPSVVGGQKLAERLRGAGLEITVGEFKKSSK